MYIHSTHLTQAHAVGVGALAVLVLLSFLYLHSADGSDASVEASSLAPSTPGMTYLQTRTVPVRVSGVVRAVDHVTIYAQTAGVVTTLPVREGALVSRGDLLAIQASPVTDAHIARVSAENEVRSLEQSRARDMRDIEAHQAGTRATSASEVARLRASSTHARFEEAGTALATALDQSILTMAQALDYIHTNRYLFSAEGLVLYTDIVREIYGTTPRHLRGPLLIPGRETTGLTRGLQEAREVDDFPALQSLSARAETQLIALTELLQTVEEEILERNTSYVSEEMREEYTRQRTSILSAVQTLQSADARFVQAANNKREDAASQQTNVAVGDLDEELAQMQAQYAERLARQSDVVSDAALGVVAAEQALARPRAPFSGLVARVFVDEGEYVTPGTPLLSLVGDGAREIVVSVPAHLLSGVTVGQSLMRGDDTIGQVARVSQVADGGSGIVIVTLDTTYEMRVGSAVSGTLSLEHSGVFAVPRSYVFFDNDGPYITYANGEVSRVSVVYDTGSVLYVEVSHVLDQPLRRAHSVSL